MKTFALAVIAATGLLLTANSADAQYRYRSSNSYSTYRSGTIYNAPSYGYPSTYYATPTTYSSGIVTSGYTPYYGDNVVVPVSGYSSYYAPTYTYPGYVTYPSYSTYSGGAYITPSGGMFRGRGWRW